MPQYKKLIDYYFPVAEEIFSISGEITKIQANAEENIKDKTEFIAKAIELYLMPETE